MHRAPHKEETAVAPVADLGMLDASMRARVSAGQHASFTLIADDAESAQVTCEIAASQDGSDRSVERHTFQTGGSGSISLPHKIADVTIVGEQLDVTIGDGQSCELVAPILIDVGTLTINAAEVIAAAMPTRHDRDISLFAELADTERLTQPPRVLSDPTVAVNWPGSEIFPWRAFNIAARPQAEPKLEEAQRALRRLVLSFRSHSRNQLARYEEKVEHRRMTKGDVGVTLREALEERGVLSFDEPMYYLDPDALGREVGVDFLSLKRRTFSEKTNIWLADVLADRQD
jgi:hypothetical protein